MSTPKFYSKTKCLLSNFITSSKMIIQSDSSFLRSYAKKSSDDDCRRAIVDIPPEVDPLCPKSCEKIKKKEGILRRIKMKVIEGGTNFGTPFRRLECKEKVCKEEKTPVTKALPPPKKVVLPMPAPRPGVQVSVLGADTAVGQYVALLLKQCPCIKKLRLFESKDSQCSDCNRDLYKVVEDLKHINTNCLVQAFSCACNELERCLQNTDIVLMLDSGYINMDMPLEKRFEYQAPIVKNYADAIANECPKAFIIVCASPIDCMVPLIAEHNALMMTDAVRSAPMAVARSDGDCMRAADLSEAHALAGLVTKVARALLCHDISKVTGFIQTDASQVVSPARYIANTVEIGGSGISKCLGLPKMTDTETVLVDLALNELYEKLNMVEDWYNKYSSSSNRLDSSQFNFFTPKSYQRFLAIDMLLNNHGICKRFDFPAKMNSVELELMDMAFAQVMQNVKLAQCWHAALIEKECERCQMAMQINWNQPRHYHHLDSCAVHLT